MSIMKKFNTDDLKKSFPQLEQQVINYWKKNKIFEKSIENRSIDNLYSFYDGPPFITGLPHYGSLLPSIAKDVIPRYQTMKGKRVRRVWGWDCHGLPAENKVEEKLGLNGKKDIEKLGIDKFIDECKLYVTEVSSEWDWYIDHIGRWVDFENAYKTMDLSYMESVLWVFKQIYEKGYIYKGTRTSLFCPRDSTPISNFEIAMDNSYKDLEDTTVTVKFKIKGRNSYILAWTTTPWTLPGNCALAVNKDEQYSELEWEGEKYIVASALVSKYFDKPKIIHTFKGSELLGLEYEPLFDFFPSGPNDHKVYAGDFVTMEDGTGVVHIAPGFGEDDHNLGKKENLSIIVHVDEEGKFVNEVKPWKGLFFRKANVPIIEDLKSRNLLFKSEDIVHSYPVCWRCGTPLLFRTQEAWYVNVEKIKPRMIELNENINWVPKHIKHGRFQKGLESAPDWCISRSRYWGTPIPIWECKDCGKIHVIGSLAELKELSGVDVKDLHRPGIDEVVINCSCGGKAYRVKEVLDCWFESGSMPFAQLHFPFDNKQIFEKGYPADYVVEYIAQVRGWFYTMHVISAALMDSHSFKNVVVTGVIMGSDGRKMSKLFKNYPDPKLTLEKYGGDALRLILMGSSLMAGEDFNINEPDIQNQVKQILLPIWNTYKYLLTYANLYGLDTTESESTDILDKWVLLKLKEFTKQVSHSLDKYNLPDAVKAIQPFIEDVSTWYIRRSRKRFADGDQKALNTLYKVLTEFSLVTAPIIPFISETIFLNLMDDKDTLSVHLQDYPKLKKISDDEKQLELDMESVREIANLGQAQRVENKVKVRQPLQSVTLGKDYKGLKNNKDLLDIIADELNVKEVFFNNNNGITIDFNLSQELKEEGLVREIIRSVQDQRKKQNFKLNDEVNILWTSEDKDIQNIFTKYKENIQVAVKAKDIIQSEVDTNPVNVNQYKVKFSIIKHV